MASFKQIKFYLLLLIGLAVSLLAVYLLLTSTLISVLSNLGQGAYSPTLYSTVYNDLRSRRTETVTITANNHNYYLNTIIAENEQDREKGLMGITNLNADSAMLFKFQDSPRIRSFWMKNTKIHLDLIFLDQSKRIIYIQQNAPPCPADPCPIYTSQAPAQYVIETNGNWSINHNVGTGSHAIFQ